MKKEVFDWIKSLVICLVVAFIITLFVQPVQVHSVSMNPTLVEKDWLVMIKGNDIKAGDIISFQSSVEFSDYELDKLNFLQKMKAGQYKSLIKRVIAVEGDALVIEDGKVFVNGEELMEDYIKGYSTSGNIKFDEIPDGKVFVMGDNRNNSLDSRSTEVGLVDIEDIQGKVVFRFFPIFKIGVIK